MACEIDLIWGLLNALIHIEWLLGPYRGKELEQIVLQIAPHNPSICRFVLMFGVSLF